MFTSLTVMHATDQQLILYALGHHDDGLAAHLATCASCRSQAESYHATLAATREALTPAVGRVNLVSCENQCVLEGAECQLQDSPHTLRVEMQVIDGVLYGHVTVEDVCNCWYDAPVRLFGPFGLVASTQVDQHGDFEFPLPPTNQRYSLGLVLTRHGQADLEIIGNFELR